jgi:8-oxo-dGTP diphosphatase
MSKAARAIILNGNKLLVMHRNKEGSQYYTLVGGRVNERESIEEALVRELKEETGLVVTKYQLVFIEEHPTPYNEQYIYLCQVDSLDSVAIQDDSEEGMMNRRNVNIHQPFWVDIQSFENLAFRTPQLQSAILKGLKRGFPKEPLKL